MSDFGEKGIRTGVHRGRIEQGSVLTGVERILKEIFGDNSPQISIEGSLSNGPKGSRRTDLDIKASRPTGYSESQLNGIERTIQDETGADFYFED